MIREQANSPLRNVETETRKVLFREMMRESYKSTCLIVHDMSHHSNRLYNYAKNHRKFQQEGIVVKDRKGRLNSKQFTRDIFKKGVFHGKCSLTNVMHIAVYLQYKKVIYAGVDLKNSRYFWLPKTSTRSNIVRRDLKYSSPHPVARPTMTLLRNIKKHFGLKMSTLNKRSMLAKMMPYEDLK